MADLQAMFQNLGPTGGALMSGIQMGQQYNANESEQAMRQLQMDKILQETEQAKLMNPLALQAKQQEVSDAQLKAKREDHAYMTKLLGDAIPTLEKVKDLPGQRLAALKQYAESHGRPLSEQDLTQYSQDPTLLDTLKAQHKWAITQDKQYQIEEMKRQSAEKIAAGHDAAARYGVDQRANAAAAKNKGIATIDEQVKTGKMSAEKAAVAFYGAAQMETDPTEQKRMLDAAARYEQLAMNLKNAGAQGRVDVGAAANLPTQTIPSALGGAPAAPAAPQHTFADVQKMYPNASPDQLRKAYKDKFGVDLK